MSSASTIPAANQEKNAGGQFHGLSPVVPENGMRTHSRLSAATAMITPMRARTGNRRASSASIGNAR